MTRAKITREQVWDACEILRSQNQPVTVRAVWAAIGYQGSLSTVSKYLSERAEQEREVFQYEEMPAEIQLLLGKCYCQILEQVRSADASDKVAALEERIGELEAQLEGYETTKAELRGWQSAYAQMVERLEQLSRENERWQQSRESACEIEAAGEQPNELNSHESVKLSQRQLIERLGVSKRTLQRHKKQKDFSSWSRSIDPEGIPWRYESDGSFKSLQLSSPPQQIATPKPDHLES